MRAMLGMAVLAAVAASAGCSDPGPANGSDAGPDSTMSDTPRTDVATDPGDPDTAAADTPADAKPFVAGPDPDTLPLYDESVIVEFRLAFAPAEWAAFTDCWKNPPAAVLAQTDKCPFVHCSFAFDGTTFPDAACRPKGNPDSWDTEWKPQFLVRFNEWDPEGRFLGMRRLNLEFNNDYGAPIRDRMAMGFLRSVGIDASRANHARVFVDDVPYGLYQNLEPLDREFLEDHFADPTGNLYDEFGEQKTNEATPTTERLDRLNETIEGEALGGNHAAFIGSMGGLLDVDVALRMLAAEILLPTTDNLKDGGGNFYWYDQPGRGFVVLPWDLDDALSDAASPDQDPGSCQAGPEYADAPSPLCLLIHDIPAWDAQVTDHVVAWRDAQYAALASRATAICDQVRPFLLEGAPVDRQEDLQDEFDRDCSAMPGRIADRIAFLVSKLGR